MRQLYESKPWSELLEALPGRGRVGIYKRAHRLGLKRELHEFDEATRQRFGELARQNKPRLGTGSRVVVLFGQPSKMCTTCGYWAPLEQFPIHASCTGGRRNLCRSCGAAAVRDWSRKNPERAVANARRWQERNHERYLETKRAAQTKRHGREVEGRVGVKELRARWAEFGGRCGYCLAPAETNDHMTPLSRGGRHEIANIVPACRRCNFKKHTKTLVEVLLSQSELRS